MSEKKDFFQKKLSNTRSFKRQQKSSINWIIVSIVAIFVLLLWYLFYRIFFASPNISLEDPHQEQIFSLWQEIFLDGELLSNGDIITHTHTIIDTNYWSIAVKSKFVNLWDFSGIVQASGVVEKFYQGKPIIEITSLSGSQNILGETGTTTDVVLDESSGVYLLSAGIHFLPSFFEEFVLLNEGENGQILIQDLDTDQEITLNYFRCNASNPDKNCKGLVDTFSKTAARSFVTANGDTYYKQSEVNSWFVANGDRWGIFINDVPEELVMKLKDVIVFANEKVIKNRVSFSSPRVCQNDVEKLQKVTKSSITLKQEWLIASLEGEWFSHPVSCSVLIDFSLPNKGKLLEFSVSNDSLTPSTQDSEIVLSSGANDSLDTGKNEAEIIVPLEWNPNVEQFPLNIEKGLSYVSSRGWYTMKFPSANISYSVSAVKENFWQANLSCSSVINVIKYSEKDSLEISPALRIYECVAKGDVTSPGEHYLLIHAVEKTFVVQINDPAWINFANALEISLL